MLASVRSVLVAAIASITALPVSAAVNFRGTGQVNQGDATLFLMKELETKDEDHHLLNIERNLSSMFVSLPKNEHGNLEYQTVRYALHRYFLNRHGWFVRGLEPKNASWKPAPNLPKSYVVQEWVPTFLQETMAQRVGDHGASLHDIAALAATLEDLVKKEVQNRLQVAFQVEELTENEDLDRPRAVAVLDTYLLSFLLANNFTIRSKRELYKKKTIFANKYRGFAQVHDWYQTLVDRHFGFNDSTATFKFSDIASAAHEIGEEYHNFNEQECSSLRTTLRAMESRRAGRVRLSSFYNMSLWSHWRFTEKPEYLKSLGILDESDPKAPAVVIPNYAMARMNCLDASSLYVICCRNSCEEIMSEIEGKLGSPAGSPRRLAEIVSNIPSDTVQAPRELDSTLSSRLDEVAEHNGGVVPIHGRLFAQWMHHAYPLECPYPHVTDDLNPQTPEEWLAATGHTDEMANVDVRQRYVDEDICAINWEGNVECEGEQTDLPWVMTEKLLSASLPSSEDDDRDPTMYVGVMALCLSGVTLAGAAVVSKQKASRFVNHGPIRLFALMTVLLLCLVAYCVDVLDGFMALIVLFGGAAAGIGSLLGQKNSKGKKLPI